jgi:hypothetical protein
MHERRLLDSFTEALRGRERRPHSLGGPEMQGYARADVEELYAKCDETSAYSKDSDFWTAPLK